MVAWFQSNLTIYDLAVMIVFDHAFDIKEFVQYNELGILELEQQWIV